MVRVNIQEEQLDYLRNIPIFEAFTDLEFKQLQREMRFRKYKKGQVLFDEGDHRDKVFYLLKGLVRLERYDESALYMYTDYVKQEKLFPYGELFSEGVYRYTAYAMTDIELYYIPAKLFEEVLAGNRRQLLYYYRRLTKILVEHENRIQFLVGSTAGSRIIKALAFLMEELGEPHSRSEVVVPYPITVCEVATISGCSRETVGNKLKQLRELGKLEHQQKILIFKDRDYFIDYSED